MLWHSRDIFGSSLRLFANNHWSTVLFRRSCRPSWNTSWGRWYSCCCACSVCRWRHSWVLTPESSSDWCACLFSWCSSSRLRNWIVLQKCSRWGISDSGSPHGWAGVRNLVPCCPGQISSEPVRHSPAEYSAQASRIFSLICCSSVGRSNHEIDFYRSSCRLCHCFFFLAGSNYCVSLMHSVCCPWPWLPPSVRLPSCNFYPSVSVSFACFP